MNPKVKYLILFAIIALGFYVRFTDLDTHFTHIDDIGVAKIILIIEDRTYNASPGLNYLLVNLISSVAIPHAFTYAPLQYWITPWLIDHEQTYREVLFWGRFPSFVFGMLGLIAIIFFYKKHKPENPFPYQLLALTILTFSWENIIYAKQMENYALGVLSAILLLVILQHYLSLNALKFRHLIGLSFLTAILSHAHYQILFLSPALYLTIFIFHWKRTESRPGLIRNFAFAGIAFLLLIAPMYILYLSRYLHFGVHWNAGPGEKYIFTPAVAEGAWNKIIYALHFLFVYFLEVFQLVIAFMPEDKTPLRIMTVVLLVLLLLGVISFVTSTGRKKYFALFLGMVAVTWLALIFTRKITFSPTRHSLILLPFFVLCICEGLEYAIAKISLFRDKVNALTVGSLVLSLLIISGFLLFYRNIMHERQDVFNPAEIKQIFEEHKTDVVVQYVYTANMYLMKDIKNTYPVFMHNEWKDSMTNHTDAETIALISSRKPFPYTILDSRREFITPEHQFIISDSATSDFELVYKKEILSDVQVDFSRKTQNGTNSLFLYIFKKKKNKQEVI